MNLEVQYEGEEPVWLAVRIGNRFAVAAPPGESLESVKQFEQDLKKFLNETFGFTFDL
jgi:hypothetical protein